MMSLFKDMLKSGESLFRDEIALDYDYLPKLIPYREKEQFYMANCIKLLMQNRNGKNLLIHGAPGIGKTAATKHVLRELENETDDVSPIYVNCWKKNTATKIIFDICEQLKMKFLANKTKEELLEMLKKEINKHSAVFVLDEVDKLEDDDIIYTLIEEINRKSIFLITNYRTWLNDLDERIKSRLTAEMLEFKEYNEFETRGILKNRADHAFVPGVFEEEAFELIAKRTAELKDIRSGLYLLKEAALSTENRSSKKISLQDAESAIKKLDEFAVKKSTDLEDQAHIILDIIKNNDNTKIGDLFNIYTKSNGTLSYKSFYRRIKKLETDGFITVDRTLGGDEGNTSIIKFKSITKPAAKKLTDF